MRSDHRATEVHAYLHVQNTIGLHLTILSTTLVAQTEQLIHSVCMSMYYKLVWNEMIFHTDIWYADLS